MTRDDFLAAFRELAEKLGAELWRIVERQTERAKAAALDVAMGQLRSEIDSGGQTKRVQGPRGARRCSTCQETGHDSRNCHSIHVNRQKADQAAATPSTDLGPEQPIPRRAPRRCSTCRQPGHDARRCGRSGPASAEAPTAADPPADGPTEPEPEPGPEPGPDAERSDEPEPGPTPDEDDTDDDDADPSEAPSPPPTRTDRFARIEAAARVRRREA